MTETLKIIPIEQLKRCPIQLRPVKRETVEYYILRDSIKDVGILMPILVRLVNGMYEVVAGNHRFSCAEDLRFKEVPCLIRELTDEEVLRVQVIENANHIVTTPVDYIRRLQKIVHTGQMTIPELAHHIHKHPDWVKRLLSLNCLSAKAKELLDKKELSIKLGIELAKLDLSEQDALLDLYGTVDDSEFLELLRDQLRHKRTDRAKQRQQSNGGLKPHFRKMGIYTDEIENGTNAAMVLTRAGAETALDGWREAIKWVLQLDQESVSIRTARKNKTEELFRQVSEHRNREMKARKDEHRPCKDD